MSVTACAGRALNSGTWAGKTIGQLVGPGVVEAHGPVAVGALPGRALEQPRVGEQSATASECVQALYGAACTTAMMRVAMAIDALLVATPRPTRRFQWITAEGCLFAQAAWAKPGAAAATAAAAAVATVWVRTLRRCMVQTALTAAVPTGCPATAAALPMCSRVGASPMPGLLDAISARAGTSRRVRVASSGARWGGHGCTGRRARCAPCRAAARSFRAG